MNLGSRLRLIIHSLICMLLLSSCAATQSRLQQPKADLILHNAQVLTVDQQFSKAQALAISGDRLMFVGDNEQALKLKGEITRVIDLKGATVLPGINDAHIHLAWWGLTLNQLDLRDRSIEEIKDLLAERVAQSQPGEVIRGMGWSEGSIGRMPTREDIDHLTPDNPVAFEEMGHALWANSKMLELAGIGGDAIAPAGSKFERNKSTGELTGVLHDADHLIFPYIPEVSDAVKKQAIIDAIDLLNKQGVTSLTDPGVTSDQVALYEALAAENKLSARVSVHLRAGRSLAEAKTAVSNYQDKSKYEGTTHNLLTLRGIKLYMDGAPPGRTAFMFEDYVCCPGEKGLLLYQGETEAQQIEEITRSVEWLHRQGYQMGIHADGDRSANVAIEGLIEAMRNYPVDSESPERNSLRHYLIHGDLVRDEDIQQMAEWNIGLAIQPVITYEAGDLLLHLWGQERGERHMATGLFVDAGVWTSLSTDSPIVPPNWKQNIEYAVLRENKNSPGKVNGAGYRISVKDAIIAHTRTPAYQDFQDDIKGTLEAGKLADLVVIDQDILSIDPHRISEIKTLMTVLGGQIVYEELASTGTP